ncbi:hypothetical protein E3Q17_01188 [Wallemia mellicola]|uniref:N1221-domain-containing protein n=1 Tax=Wallemia mellicola TaxID=1708541 RepID=A0A4T0TRK6_9BASI|nr:hypothetical protein E3Q17_01188 [Wallemia mellicola]TIC19200.1 hypothetical protein E3Q13_01406 [Wallemia mellicola]TIC21395.1 hypothetical protein E3Q12_03444 [Wallemia mellicola]TIC36163.1 hypothetical protein E3Q09_01562 [Wallemia mellicola]TIC44737.1 hypothetical protein E3Q08_01754 [Wallemia mellicola]
MISIDDDFEERQGRQSNPHLEPFDTFMDFKYNDDDNIMNEINEFYSYLDVRCILDGKHEWLDADYGSWWAMEDAQRRDLLAKLLNAINGDKLSERLKASRKLLYVMQGSFIESKSTKHHLDCIIENVKLVRECGGLNKIASALRAAISFHSIVHTDYAHLAEPDFIEQVNVELGSYMEMLYYMVQILRHDSTFADELMNLEPSLPTYLFTLLSGLRDKTAKGYPVKKLLLLLWKTLLVVFGGWEDIDCLKDISYELFKCNLAVKDDNTILKSNPLDLQQFYSQTSLKYPTYRPKQQSLPLNGLTLASAPAPLKTSAPNQDIPSAFSVSGPTVSGGSTSTINTSAPGNGIPGTPLPTPPPSPAYNGPKLKKTQFQTDQTKPFIFPFSESTSTVPTSIDEAGRLFAAHMHVPISLWQTHQIRKDFVRSLGFTNRYAEIAEAEYESNAPVDDFDTCSVANQISNLNSDHKIYVDKLMRVEVVYREILPYLHNCVIVLLKLLLASLNSQNTGGHAHEGEHSAMSLDDIDVARHREITSKAVSAIILLLLKWFKVSHVMKFQWLSTLLVDSNCILLMLKMYGFQDVVTMMRTQHEVEELNFFNYCHTYGTSTQDGSHRKVPSINSNDGIPDFETFEKPDLRTFSWRNLFSTINFMRIVQKLSKKRTHRLLLLVQYKSSAMLKRLLRISEPRLQLYILKIIKGQVPYYGRKWRQCGRALFCQPTKANMKVITAIYLNCRPELRDEWLASADVDQEIEDSLPQEQSLRAFVKFCKLFFFAC